MAKRRWIDLLFLIYLLILLRITVFRSGWLTNERFGGTVVLVPFHSVFTHLLSGNWTYFLYLFVGNLIWFMPPGAYLQRCGLRFVVVCLCGFFLSVCIETAQFVLSTGFSDTEDLILNTVGTMLGYGGMKYIRNRKAPNKAAANAVSALNTAGKTLVTAESCTGGLLGKLLTDVPGASRVYLGGVVTYAYALKMSLLGVDASVLEKKGAVCEEVAVQMAKGARNRLGADFALSVTGNAGPGTDDKNPNVGEIYLACADETACVCERLSLNGTREENRSEACQAALRLLLHRLEP